MTRTSRRAWRRISLVAFATLAIVASSLPLAPISSAAGNQALLLDGVNDGILLGTAGTPSPLGATQFTLELWFMRTGAGVAASTGSGGNTDSIPLITKGRSESDGTNVDTNYFLGIDASSGEIEADFEDQRATNNNNPVNGAGAVSQNVWHHAAATYSGSQFCLYLDGVLNGTCTATTQTPRSDSIQAPAIGTASDSTGALAGFFAGRVDEVRIWNVARTQQQIQGSMNSELISGTGLIGRWGVNEGAGSSVAGSVGGINGTTTGGPTWVSGAPALDGAPPSGNQALLLDGVNDGVLLGTSGTPSPLGATQFTLELWFMRTGAGAAASTGTGGNTDSIPLITKGRSETDGSNVDANYFLGIDASSGELEADFEDLRATNNNNPVNGAGAVSQNVWHHAAATYDSTQFCLYLDGALNGTCTATTQTPRSDSIQAPAIGTASDSTGVLAGFFAGRVDEVRIWNVARTQAQIQGSMNSELTSGTGLIGRWGLNDGAGTSVAGSVGGINGTTTGGPTWVSGAPALDGPPPSGNTGLQFNGSSQHVTFGAAPGLGASTFTVETWFKRTGTGVGTDTGSGGIASAVPLVTKGRAESDNSNVDMNYFLGIDTSNNRLVIDYEEGAGQTTPGLNHPLTGSTDVTSNVWHHAAATFDGTTLRIYLDGVINGTLVVGSNRAPRSDSIQHAALATAMNSTGVASGFFAGVLDESRIWSVARTDTQIANSMNSELTSGTGLIGRWGMNEGAGTSVAGSVGGINGTTVNGPTWVAGAPFSVGAAPNAPTLVAPADNATGISTSPTLDVTVSDPDTDPVDVTFYGRSLNGPPGPDFTIVAIPDTQHYSEQVALTPIYNAQMQWIVDSQDDLNTVFASHLGDIVENAGNTPEWTRADAAQDILDNNGVKNGVLPGNHDMNVTNGNAANYDIWFPPSRYQGNAWYGGYLGSSPSDPVNRLNKDNYELFSAGGMDFLIIHLEHDMPAYAVNWAQTIIDAFPSRKVIISTHAFVNQNNIRPTSPYNRPDGMSAEAVWQQLVSPNCQIFMVINGHYHGEGRRTDNNSCGQPVFQLNSDYQDDPNGGDGWLRYYTFKPAENKIYAFTYSPTRNNGNGDFETDADSQFVMDWPMSGSSQFTQIGTVQDVPSGQHATLQWNGLNGATEYEWYADVSDSSHTVTGPTWSFTTEVPPPAPPVVDSVTINQLSPRTADTLSTTVTSHDPNNDPVTYTYQWVKNGSDIPGATAATLDLSLNGNGNRGDQIGVRVVAHDGTFDSAPVTSSTVTILNTLPSATVSVAPSPAGTNSTLTATATKTDLDTDPVTLTYVWKVNGTVRKTTPASTSLTDTFDLSQAGNGDVGDTVSVEVTPNDGTANGTLVSSNVAVASAIVSAIPDSTYQVNGTVRAILRIGNRVYIGGDFTQLLGHNGEVVNRLNLAALDATTGLPVAWDPSADGTVYDLAASPDGTRVYAAGVFRHLGTLTRERIAAIDATSGAVVNWTPAAHATVRTVATSGDLVYIGGTFTTVTGAAGQGPQSRTRLAAISATTGRVDTTWIPSASASPLNMVVTPDNRVIVVGNFTTMNSSPASRIAALDGTSGASLPWQGSLSQGAGGIAQSPNRIFVGVGVGAGGNQVVAFNSTTGAQQWIVNGNGDVTSVDFLDGTVYAGGHFSQIAGQTRNRLAAFDANNGALRNEWQPTVVDPFEVDAMYVSGNYLYVGGNFIQVSGQNQRGFAAFKNNANNASPVVDTVSINQSSPGTNDTLSVTVTSHDPDNDPVTYAYQWSKNGTDIAGATSSTLDLSQTANGGNGNRGDLIRVRVTANDGNSTSAPLTSAPVTVANTAPTATVALDDDTPGTNDTLTATATRADADGDTVTLTYVWKVNGTTRKTTSGTSSLTDTFDLSQAGNGDDGETVTVEVTPNDGAVSGSAASDLAVVTGTATAIFADDFTGGNFSNWTSATRLTIDGGTGSPAAPSARAQVTAQSAFATKLLTGTFSQVCMSMSVNVATQGGTAIDLLRLRTAANGPVAKVYLNGQGTLLVRSDVASTQQSSSTAIGTGWHELELCGTVGAAGTWDLYRDGIRIVNAWAANTGTTPVGMIQIGDNAARTMTVNFDHVRVDQSPGEGSPPPQDTTPPTTPGKPAGTSPSPGTISISWAASTDQSPPITYSIFRDGGVINTTTNTSYSDTGLVGGSSHTYAVQATDAFTNTSQMSLVSDPIVVTSGTPAIFADEFSSNDFTNWTSATRLTIDGGTGSPAAPSARAQVTAQSAFATKLLTGTFSQVCMSMNVNVTTQGGTAIDLLRLRTAANGPVAKVYLNGQGTLLVRSDVASTQQSSSTAIGTGWHELELCGTVGAAGTWDLYRDGIRIVNAWAANTGTTPVGMIQIGDNAVRTMTVNFDHVRVDQVAG